MSAAGARSARPSGARRVRLGLMALFVVLLFVQFYLAGRGVFRASPDYEAHEMLGGILHIISLVILIATIAIPATRNRVDIGMAVGLLVLVTIQIAIGTFETPELGAFHPVNALLVVGLAFGMLSRDRRAIAA